MTMQVAEIQDVCPDVTEEEAIKALELCRNKYALNPESMHGTQGLQACQQSCASCTTMLLWQEGETRSFMHSLMHNHVHCMHGCNVTQHHASHT